MKNRLFSVVTGMCVFVLPTLCVPSSGAQATEVKEKPPMYSYVAEWQVPRAQWADMEKAASAEASVMDKALADGTIVGYGHDETAVHQENGYTHDNWWSAMSMAGLMKALDQIAAANKNAPSSALMSATKHSDAILVSRYYNWHSGSWKNGYVHIGSYKLKADAPDDALDTLSRRLVVPLLEKLLADGTIREYEIDTEAIHTNAPGTFWIIYVASSPEGLDTVNAAVIASQKADPLSSAAFGSAVDDSAHRDELVKGGGTFK